MLDITQVSFNDDNGEVHLELLAKNIEQITVFPNPSNGNFKLFFDDNDGRFKTCAQIPLVGRNQGTFVVEDHKLCGIRT